MIRLLGVEVRRDLSRRLIRFLVAFALGCIAVMGVLVFVNNEGHSTEEVERIEREETRFVERCVEQAVRFGDSEDVARSYCEDSVGTDEVLHLTELWTGSDFETDGGGILSVGVILLLMGGLFAGATVIGAEWRHGTMQTQLTWEPRRYRLLGTKFLAAALLGALIAFLLEAVFVLAFVPTVMVKGSTAGTDLAWYSGLTLAMGRGALLAVAAVLLGATIASVARNAGAGVGVVLGWVAVAEPLLRSQLPDWEPYQLTTALAAIIPWSDFPIGEQILSPVEASVTLGAYVFVFVAGALVVFARRDVPGAT